MHRARLIALLVLAAAVAVAAFFLPWREALAELLRDAEELGPKGAVLVASLFVPASLLMLPGSPITLACGAAFGFLPAFLSVVVFSNLGAQAAFLLGRWLLRERIQRRVRASPRLDAIDRAIGHDDLRTVFLLRLSPLVPFNALNYALSVSPVRFRSYALATFAGMLPGTVLYCYAAVALGQAGEALAGEVQTGAGGTALTVVGLVATAVVVVTITRRARRALAEVLPPDAGS